MNEQKLVIIAAGGTAGHINPALALAEELNDRGYDLLFIGTPNSLEERLVPMAGFAFLAIESSGFDRSKPWTLAKGGFQVLQGRRKLKRLFKEKKPVCGMGFGAYLEVSCLAALRSLKIPYGIHEQNSVPGLANKIMARDAHLIAVTYPMTVDILKERAQNPACKVVVTGNPVRKQIVESNAIKARKILNIDKDARVLLIFGGSNGARHINQTVARLKKAILSRSDIIVLHATGKDMYQEALNDLELTPKEAERWRVIDYIDEMGVYLKACDLVLSRAGATSIAEIEATNTPSLLIPYPYATDNHQESNAKSLVKDGAAAMVLDKNLDSKEFETKLFSLIDNQHTLDSMREALEKRGAHMASQRLADEVESIIL